MSESGIVGSFVASMSHMFVCPLNSHDTNALTLWLFLLMLHFTWSRNNCSSLAPATFTPSTSIFGLTSYFCSSPITTWPLANASNSSPNADINCIHERIHRRHPRTRIHGDPTPNSLPPLIMEAFDPATDGIE